MFITHCSCTCNCYATGVRPELVLAQENLDKFRGALLLSHLSLRNVQINLSETVGTEFSVQKQSVDSEKRYEGDLAGYINEKSPVKKQNKSGKIIETKSTDKAHRPDHEKASNKTPKKSNNKPEKTSKTEKPKKNSATKKPRDSEETLIKPAKKTSHNNGNFTEKPNFGR